MEHYEYEYEPAGKADATMESFKVYESILKGGSGIVELGVIGNVGKFSIDIGGT